MYFTMQKIDNNEEIYYISSFEIMYQKNKQYHIEVRLLLHTQLPTELYKLKMAYKSSSSESSSISMDHIPESGSRTTTNNSGGQILISMKICTHKNYPLYGSTNNKRDIVISIYQIHYHVFYYARD